jgi:flavodoxin I
MRTEEHSPCTWVTPKSGLVVLVVDDNEEDVERCMIEAARAGVNMKLLQPCEDRSPKPEDTLASLLLASAPALASRGSRVRSMPQMSTGLYYSTSTGNTETVAEYIANAAGVEDWKDIADADDAEITGHDSIIVGAPTWHTGADSERSGTSWDEWLYNTLPNLDFSGKKVAIFGVGDSSGYGDNYCDATGELYDCFTGKGAKVFGNTPSDSGFDYTESKGVVDGKFVGVVFDEDNYGDESEARANAWVDQLKSEGFM